ncbi:uncharacterized protein BJX67DRAFT_148008 [Aspergillus lucknowensis]|uniref:GPI anchored serine-threonine rich protein n=1 Tax=Aspergillus lucknowensis TaxID=176173 RepID=A0ABR4LNH6_9EURO
MYKSVLVLGSLLAGNALAASHLAPFSAGINKRQGGDSFTPIVTPGCPDGWPVCGTSQVCYNPGRGDTCCPGGEYACPTGSFCLQDGYCCPDGLDRETCAEEFGITLNPTTTPTPTSSRPVIPTGTSSPTNTPPASSSPVPPPPEFTGGASIQAVGAAAAVLGGLGMIGNIVL